MKLNSNDIFKILKQTREFLKPKRSSNVPQNWKDPCAGISCFGNASYTGKVYVCCITLWESRVLCLQNNVH